jgi:hypothetical protein
MSPKEIADFGSRFALNAGEDAGAPSSDDLAFTLMHFLGKGGRSLWRAVEITDRQSELLCIQ